MGDVGLVALLVSAVVAFIIGFIVYLIGQFFDPDPRKKIALSIGGVVALLVFIARMGWL